MRDPYSVLGLSKSATADEIKSAYRKLAKKLHPDVNPGRKDIEAKFKDVTAAYDILSDPAKRQRFDSGEIDGGGNERGFSGDPYAGRRPRSGKAGADPFSQFNAEDLFAQFMRGTRGQGPGVGAMPGEDASYSLSIPFVAAALGDKQRVTLGNKKTIDVMIPAGVTEGYKLRLRGQGGISAGGAGDAIVEIHIESHPYFTRKDNDILIDVPISLPEALLGTTINVPTLDGHVAVKVPKNANTGTTLRLKGKGIPKSKTETGDMFAKLKVMLPDSASPDLTELIEKWAKKNAYNPRKKLGWE